ncbi:putative ribosomal large subunit pseudouridine synthase SVR1, chloroplastic isoform X2 [Olea europaea var. sylvestris]|uniref:putative ribosomal large subunit pseudouridine synthase SVR1, chloroplastic isoform X2 n=2 Tax=Olea europaea var. sylvestris TaxID=158386 RepID=UPI000C1D7910|nr:putative ribosomal large subunit pseudouridine synthase SVR1, chloroplastic isoform X2 [Olea europaea var. sylvestris]
MAAATYAFTTLRLSKPPFLSHTTRRHLRTLITCSSSSTTTEFNIKFAPPKPKLKSESKLRQTPAPNSESPESVSSELGDQLYIPWIVRDENGNLTLQTTPPARLIQAMAHTNTQKKKKKDNSNINNNSNKAKQPASTAEPKYSKAARRFYNENFREQLQRLAKVLAASGVASRRSSEELIFQGKVTVNGSVCNAPQTRVDPAQDVIYVNGSRLAKKLPPKLHMLSRRKGNQNKRNPGVPKPRLFTVGRLDVATTGLIIVTNDGEFAHKLSHPSSNLSKEYIATIDGAVNKRHLLALSEGTVVDGVHCTPDVVELLPQQPDILRSRLRIVIHQGRNHEVRELVKNAGLQIHALKRVRIAGFRLPSGLALGKHVELSPSNLRALGYKS